MLGVKSCFISPSPFARLSRTACFNLQVTLVEKQLFNLALTLQLGLSLNSFSLTSLISLRNEEDYYYGGGHSAGLMSCGSTAEESCVANNV